jgi:hypothetical protein
MLVSIAIAAIVLLIAWNFVRLYRFQTDYKFDGLFQGVRYECKLGGLGDEHRTLCLIGADEFGLYLLPHPNPPRHWWAYPSGYRIFKKSLYIPWTDIRCRYGRVLLKDCIWFDLKPRRVYLYVPKDVGEKVLVDARRQVPA